MVELFNAAFPAEMIVFCVAALAAIVAARALARWAWRRIVATSRGPSANIGAPRWFCANCDVQVMPGEALCGACRGGGRLRAGAEDEDTAALPDVVVESLCVAAGCVAPVTPGVDFCDACDARRKVRGFAVCKRETPGGDGAVTVPAPGAPRMLPYADLMAIREKWDMGDPSDFVVLPMGAGKMEMSALFDREMAKASAVFDAEFVKSINAEAERLAARERHRKSRRDHARTKGRHKAKDGRPRSERKHRGAFRTGLEA